MLSGWLAGCLAAEIIGEGTFPYRRSWSTEGGGETKDYDFLQSCEFRFLMSLKSTGVKECRAGFGFFSTYSWGPRTLRSLLCRDRTSRSTHCQVSWIKRTFSSCAGVNISPMFVGERGLEVRL